MTRTVTPEQLRELRDKNPQLSLIDVRTPAEFQEVHVEFARNLPLDRLDPQSLAGVLGAEGPATSDVYVICKSGTRGKMACEKLRSAGLEHVVNVAGGTDACVTVGLPVIRGKGVISLERQVRIVAGGLVLTGAVLALTVHPYWAGLSAFVGAGLIFAGVTDTCGMGLLLARMPWNQAGGCCQTQKQTPSACELPSNRDSNAA